MFARFRLFTVALFLPALALAEDPRFTPERFCDNERKLTVAVDEAVLQGWVSAENGLALCLVRDPALPPEFQPLLNLPLPDQLNVLRGMLVMASDPVAFGMTFQEGSDPEIAAFQMAAMNAQGNDGSRGHAFHWYGHPENNAGVVRVITTGGPAPGYFKSATNPDVNLYGEFILPTRLNEATDLRELAPVPTPPVPAASGAAATASDQGRKPETTPGVGPPSQREATPGEPPATKLYPAILAIEGLQGNIGMYRWWHQAFADAGYIVFAFDFTGQGMSGGSDGDTDATRVADAIRALDYMLEESPFARHIDRTRVGVIGHSMGAMTTLEMTDALQRQVNAGERESMPMQAAVPAAPISEKSSEFLPENALIPLMIQTGDHDGPIAPIPFVNPEVVRPVYNKLSGDRAMIVADAATHAQHTNYPILPTESHGREIAALYSLAWMDWYLKGEKRRVGDAWVLKYAHPRLSYLHTSEIDMDDEVLILKPGTVPADSLEPVAREVGTP